MTFVWHLKDWNWADPFNCFQRREEQADCIALSLSCDSNAMPFSQLDWGTAARGPEASVHKSFCLRRRPLLSNCNPINLGRE
ncbi:hypothetical protein RE6C_01951 [Rhodopirellula europaea 6C]|uniref:Uncharacterized protein n=1 Tax=Rhodopirellula europaea 6C TaxID=1263867 RepID=M2B6Q3_9BACT|nr:hypothetical protein RE6C_01951 [Rhodopirellula europaea 6C]